MNQALSLVYPTKITTDGDGFVVTFRDLDNVFTEADTYEAALFNAQDVLDILLKTMAHDELNIPSPSECINDKIPVTVSPKIAVQVLLHRLRSTKHSN